MIIDRIKERAKENVKTIILPESDDLRVLEAASVVVKEEFANIILIGKRDEVLKLALENKIDVSMCEIIDPINYHEFDDVVSEFYEIRKHKNISMDDARNIMMNDYLAFANMLVKMHQADGVVAGANHSSRDTLRPALQILKTAPAVSKASSFFLMEINNCPYGEEGVFVYADCGMNQNPSSEELSEIAKCSADSFRLLVEKEPYVAFLSHSTLGSSKCSDVSKVSLAVKIAKEKYPDVLMDGELQFDAAVVPSVAKIKAPNSKVAGRANTLVFPDLDAGNIGYKITERLAGAKAYGPVTQGLRYPVNDLSRGCSVSDIVGVVAITAVQASCHE